MLSKVEGLDFTIMDNGCCEMAGSFGYEQGHYKASQACGERVLFLVVRGTSPDDTWSSPPASTARQQIADFWDNRRSLHTAELLALAEEPCLRSTSDI